MWLTYPRTPSATVANGIICHLIFDRLYKRVFFPPLSITQSTAIYKTRCNHAAVQRLYDALTEIIT